MTISGPQHMDFPLIMISAVKWCVLFHRKSSVLFSPKLLNSECVLPSSIAVTLSAVLVLPCSCSVTAHRILSSLPFIQHQSNEVQIVLLFCTVLFGTTLVLFFVAVHSWCFLFFFKEVEIISFWGKEITLRYVPYTYLPVGKEKDHCQSSIVNYEKIKIKHVKCLVRPEKKKIKC